MSELNPRTFYFQLPAYPLMRCSLNCFRLFLPFHKPFDRFAILTFRPSFFCEPSAFGRFVGGQLVAELLWLLLTSALLWWFTRRHPKVSVRTFSSSSPCIYIIVFRTVLGFCLRCNIAHTITPYMQFLFVDPNFCRQLPSDSNSLWTPLLLANTSHCIGVFGTFTLECVHMLGAQQKLRSLTNRSFFSWDDKIWHFC